MNAISSRPLPARPLALPNLLTYARIAAVPVVVGLLYWLGIFDGRSFGGLNFAGHVFANALAFAKRVQ